MKKSQFSKRLITMDSEKYGKTLKLKCGRKTEDAMVQCPTGEIRIRACSEGMHELILEKPAKHIDRYR